MSSKGIIILFVIILLGGGAFFLSQNSHPASTQNVEPTPDYEAIANATMYPSGTPAGGSRNASQYVSYSKNVLNNVKEKKIVLFFFANWCPTCIPADEDFTKNVSKIPEGVVVVRVNYNDPDTDQDEKDLAKKYGITYQHTYVQIDPNGNVVTKWNGGKLEELLTNIR